MHQTEDYCIHGSDTVVKHICPTQMLEAGTLIDVLEVVEMLDSQMVIARVEVTSTKQSGWINFLNLQTGQKFAEEAQSNLDGKWSKGSIRGTTLTRHDGTRGNFEYFHIGPKDVWIKLTVEGQASEGMVFAHKIVWQDDDTWQRQSMDDVRTEYVSPVDLKASLNQILNDVVRQESWRSSGIVVRKLMAARADANHHRPDECHLLHAAIERNAHPDILQELMRAGAAASESGLVLAAELGKVDTVKVLLSAKVDVNSCPNDRSSLWSAANSNSVQCVELLLQAYADPSLKTKISGSTALEIAQLQGHDDVCALLEQASKIVFVQNSGGQVCCTTMANDRLPLGNLSLGDSVLKLRTQVSDHLHIAPWRLKLVDSEGNLLPDSMNIFDIVAQVSQ